MESRITVTGPSLTSSTSIIAPKRPIATLTPSLRSASANASTMGAADSGDGSSEEARASAFSDIGEQGELRDDERRTALFNQRAVEASRAAAEDTHLGALPCEEARGVGVVSMSHADEQ